MDIIYEVKWHFVFQRMSKNCLGETLTQAYILVGYNSGVAGSWPHVPNGHTLSARKIRTVLEGGKMAFVVVEKVFRQFFKSSSRTVIYLFRRSLGRLLKLIGLYLAAGLNSSEFARRRLACDENYEKSGRAPRLRSQRVNFIEATRSPFCGLAARLLEFP